MGGWYMDKKNCRNALLMERMWSLAQSLRQKPRTVTSTKLLVEENPDLPTVALDLDGTLVHTLVDPTDIAIAQKSGLRTIRLPGKMGLIVQRPGLEQLFSSLQGYNVVLYSAGGSVYVNSVLEKLAEQNPMLQSRFCKVLCRESLIKYSESAALPCDASLTQEGVAYVKDLRKARGDGNSQKVLLVDDNTYAFQVHPLMKDDNFKRKYNFTSNALPVPEFSAIDPEAEFDTAFALVGRVLEEIAGMQDTIAALNDHSDFAALKSLYLGRENEIETATSFCSKSDQENQISELTLIDKTAREAGIEIAGLEPQVIFSM